MYDLHNATSPAAAAAAVAALVTRAVASAAAAIYPGCRRPGRSSRRRCAVVDGSGGEASLGATCQRLRRPCTPSSALENVPSPPYLESGPKTPC